MSVLRQRFIDHLTLKGFSQTTIVHYVDNIERFSRYASTPLLRLTNNDVRNYLLYLRNERHCTAKTINQIFYSLRAFYSFFMPGSQIMAGLGRMKEPMKIPNVLSREEIERLISATYNLKEKALITLMYSSGIRLSECVNLKISDVDKERMVLRIFQGKGGKDRLAILSIRALLILREYYKMYRPKIWLFENNKHTVKLLRRQIQQFIHDAGISAGIKRAVSPHILRHSFATHLLEDGVSLQVIKELMGHTNISTTALYTHVSTTLLKIAGSPFDRVIDDTKRSEAQNGNS